MNVTPTQDGAVLSVDFDDANNLAIGIIRSMSEYDVTVAQGTAACALVLGHLLSPGDLNDDEAIKFVEFLLNNAGMYFSEGELN